MSRVPAVKSDISTLANAINNVMKKNESKCTNKIFFENNRTSSELLKKGIKNFSDMFDDSGRLTKSGIMELQKKLDKYGLPDNASWDDLLKTMWKKIEIREKLQKIYSDFINL